MPRSSRWDQETKARAIRLVHDYVGDCDSEWAAITTVAGRLGMSAETLRKWIRQAAIDTGQAAGVSTESARVRPATPLICRFIDEHRFGGVAPIFRALSEHGVPIAPRTYRAWRSRPPSKRALSVGHHDQRGVGRAGIYEPDRHGRRAPEALYGSTKMWAHLQRQGIPVAKSTVRRLMRTNGWRGTTRAKKGAHHRARSGRRPGW